MSNLHLGWERAALGTALFFPETVAEAEDLLPSDFTGSHQALWAEVISLHQRESLDLRALVESLRTRRLLEGMGASDAETSGEDYLRELLSYRGNAMGEYASGVLNASIKRQLRQVAALIQADANDEGVSAEEAADAAEKRLLALRRNRLAGRGISLGEIAGAFVNRVHGMRDGTIIPAWVPSIPAVKDVMDYIDQSDFLLIAGRPGKGKTSIMRYEFVKGAEQGDAGLIFNLENSETEYAKFAISMKTGIDSAKLKSPRLLSREELDRVLEAARKLSELPLYIVTLGSPSIDEIDRISRQYITKHSIKRIGIDYLQLVQNGHKNPVDNISYTSGIARGMASKYRIPIAGVSQLSREIVHRGGPPQLSDLRGSGSLEQDATVVWFPAEVWDEPTPHQLGMFPENLAPDGSLLAHPKALPVKMYVAKNRNGPVGESEPFLWVMSTNNYTPLRTEVRRLGV